MQHISAAKNNVVDTAGDVVDGVKAVSNQATQQTAKYLLAGLALTVGLGWNEAIKAGIKKRFPMEEGDGVYTKFIYAFALTLFLVIFSMVLAKTEVKPPDSKPSCVCADNDEVKKITLLLNNKIEGLINQRKLEKAGLVN